MRLILLTLLVGLCFSWNTAKAQGFDAKSLQNQQNWAFPSCAKPAETVVWTKFFRFDVTKDGYALALSDKASKTFPDKKDFKACLKTPKNVPPDMARLLRYIDRIHDECTLSIDNDCPRVAFKLADENRDSKLSATEIKKTVLAAFFFGELSAQKTLDAKQRKEIVARAKTEGDKITQDLLTRFDADKSKNLDYNELMTNFSAPRLPVIKEMMEKAGKTIPVFLLAAMALPKAAD